MDKPGFKAIRYFKAIEQAGGDLEKAKAIWQAPLTQNMTDEFLSYLRPETILGNGVPRRKPTRWFLFCLKVTNWRIRLAEFIAGRRFDE